MGESGSPCLLGVTITTNVHLAGGLGVGRSPRDPDLCPFLIQFKLCLKFLNQFGRNASKNQFKKQKNPSKQCTGSILLKFFNATLTSVGQKNAELIFEKLHLISKLKFRIFNSMAVIFYLSFHMLSYFRVIHNL